MDSIRLGLPDDRVIAPTADQRRQVAGVVLHHGQRYDLLVEVATLTAACLDNLRGSSQAVVRARRAMVEIIGSRASSGEVAQVLGIGSRTLRWLRTRDADPDLVMAIRLQLGFGATG